jgi:rod shape-determining protein MreD
MTVSTGRPVEVFRVHPVTLWVAVLASLLLQTFLPLKLPLARLMDFPLLVAIYFAMVRRNKIFGIGLGTILGLLQDALSHGHIGIFGMAKALAGYLAASASVRFELESILMRSVMTAVFVLIHSLTLAGLRHVLLEFPPPYEPLEMGTSILVNVSLGLVLFLLLDRFKHPA